MQRVTKLKAKNLLSHIDSEIDVASCLTVITGESNHGKSAIIRGLLQTMRNEPAGIDLLNHSAKRGVCSEFTVEGIADDSEPFSVVRRRGNTRNEYEINGVVLKAFGLNVPSEISSLFNLSPHAFHIQSDNHFLLSETEGEVARVMGRTVGLDDIDNAFAHIRKQKTENDTKLRIAESDVKRETEALEGYSGLDEADQLIEIAEQHALRHDNLSSEIVSIKESVHNSESLPAPVDTEYATQMVDLFRRKHKTTEQKAVELGLIKGCLVTLLAIPKPARVGGATNMVDTYKLHSINVSTKGAEIVTLRDLISQCDKIPPTVPLEDAQDAVCAFREVSECVDKLGSEVSSCAQYIFTLDSLPEDVTNLITKAKSDVSTYEKSTTKVLNIHRKKLAIKDSITSLAELDQEIGMINREIEETNEEIEEYRREHPTCPECGAEQENWATIEETK